MHQFGLFQQNSHFKVKSLFLTDVALLDWVIGVFFSKKWGLEEKYDSWSCLSGQIRCLETYMYFQNLAVNQIP